MTNNNRLTPENIDRIVDTFAGRAEVTHFSHLAAYEEIREQEYNLSVSTYGAGGQKIREQVLRESTSSSAPCTPNTNTRNVLQDYFGAFISPTIY